MSVRITFSFYKIAVFLFFNYILNPLLYSDLDKYIWISDSYEEHRSAQQMFDYLMKRNIYVKGFATNVQSIFHSKMYNKPILDVDTLDRKKNIVFRTAYLQATFFGIFCLFIRIHKTLYPNSIFH